MNAMHDERMDSELLDLLAERALGRLSPAAEARLDELLQAAGLEDDESIELAVAAATNAFASADSPSDDAALPRGLQARLQADADRFFARAEAGNEASEPATDIQSARARAAATRAATPGARAWAGRLGWAVAAMLAIVIVFGLDRGGPSQALDPAAAREALIAEAGTSVVEWTRSDIPAYNAVSGDVVWNDARQEGYLRLTGMPINDPGIRQYQLWIVDPQRDANPVDGGVFDVPPGVDQVIVPIRAKLDVANPEAFAITSEQPGGVVVSDGPLLIVAEPVDSTAGTS